MFKYEYYIECAKTSTTCRWDEKNYFSVRCEADEVKENIKNILNKVKENWYSDSDVLFFRITRCLVTEHFQWSEKTIFEWENPKFY